MTNKVFACKILRSARVADKEVGGFCCEETTEALRPELAYSWIWLKHDKVEVHYNNIQVRKLPDSG